MRNRWIIYLAIGLCFGILDWYFLDLLASLNQIQFLNERPANLCSDSNCSAPGFNELRHLAHSGHPGCNI